MTCRGFTLVEMLIVVIIIGILVAVAMPGLSNSSGESREAVTRQNAALLTDAIQRYRIEHGTTPGYAPGDTTPTEAAFAAQITQYSNAAGKTSDVKDRATYPYGPYLRAIPVNTLKESNRVQIIDQSDPGVVKTFGLITGDQIEDINSLAFDEGAGWVYCPQTGDIAPSDKDLFD